MSLPQFPDTPDGFTLDNSIYQILTSIAMEEVGLSHIINAEGEKLQYVLGTLEGFRPPTPPTIEQILEVNESVAEMLKQIGFNQMFLNAKMSEALKIYWKVLMNGDKDPDDKNPSDKDPDDNNPHDKDPGDKDPNDKDPGDTDLKDLENIGVGETVIIDGREWIKVRNYSLGGTNYVLLMLKNMIGPWNYGRSDQVELEYPNASIRGHVTGWYDNLDSPTLKKIATYAQAGSSPNQSWPSTSDTGIVALLPRKADVLTLPSAVRTTGQDYWLADWTCFNDACTYQAVVKWNGDSDIRGNESAHYARPIVWVNPRQI